MQKRSLSANETRLLKTVSRYARADCWTGQRLQQAGKFTQALAADNDSAHVGSRGTTESFSHQFALVLSKPISTLDHAAARHQSEQPRAASVFKASRNLGQKTQVSPRLSGQCLRSNCNHAGLRPNAVRSAIKQSGERSGYRTGWHLGHWGPLALIHSMFSARSRNRLLSESTAGAEKLANSCPNLWSHLVHYYNAAAKGISETIKKFNFFIVETKESLLLVARRGILVVP